MIPTTDNNLCSDSERKIINKFRGSAGEEPESGKAQLLNPRHGPLSWDLQGSILKSEILITLLVSPMGDTLHAPKMLTEQ